MTPLTQISASHWQLALNRPGDVVTDADDISQCIQVILTTPKGSDPLRPEFACDLWRYIDAPISKTTPHIVREAWDAIETFEPRINLISISPRSGSEPGQIILHIVWEIAGQKNQTEVTI
ncbi:GPW/gp25 family protein [Undibacterium sp. 14-3-2]|jgi:phage baseplate assembly protein W|uniref:GPW/gp25 family protein n=1 Tax=Undibacterium sp. 14-3-2 TaxID=2800129 RepID=UPI001907A352|nr:GPW/gp25 family protein [Undibacterium sp. 14-3-2]MBK1890736.1 GPW/gp25 family protein [Undibacterium sp. 14-3-2]